jgi:hypothetical protein
VKIVVLTLTAFFVVTFGVVAKAETMSPGDTYLAFHKAFLAAKKPDEIHRFYPAKKVAEFGKKSAKEQMQGFEFGKMLLETEKNLKVVSEKITESQSVVKVELCSDGKKGTTTAQLSLVKGVWKIGQLESNVSVDKC